MKKQRPGWFLLCALMAMLGKEQLPLQVAFLALYAIIRHGYRTVGLITLAITASLFFCNYVLAHPGQQRYRGASLYRLLRRSW